jgi:hypothetical protein
MAEKDCRAQLEPQAIALYSLVKPDGRNYTDAEIGNQLGVSATSVRNWRNSNKNTWEQARSSGGSLLIRLRKLLDGAIVELEQLGSAGVLEKYNLDGLIKINSLANGAEERQQRALERMLELRQQESKGQQVDYPALFLEHLQFVFRALGEGTAAHRALAEHVDSLTAAYKDHVEAKANNCA